MSDSDTPRDEVFDVDRIRRLVELMEGHDLREIDLRQEGQRIKLCRGALPMPMPMALPAAPPTSAPAASTAPLVGAPTAAQDEAHIVVVRSPMVGTFYARPNPNAAAFVKIGDMVEPETTVCIIEAMKVFNEIPAETRGKIVAVLADDEEPVDHGRPLFKVDTSAS